jgi:diguanylate cyclase (GGDEF)-like protein
MQSLSFRVGEGVAGWVVEHGKPALIHDVTEDPRFVVLPANQTPIASMICVPLIARGERVGVVTATSAKPGAFDTSNLELLRFIAMTIALDIENVRLHRVAVTDPLTGAYNREFLLQRLPQEIETAIERDRALSVAMVDVDHFKSVNEHYGHNTGDIVLTEVARRLRGAIRAGDVLVRYGGEEFLAVLPKADAGRAWEVGERMRQRVSERAFDVGDGLALLLRVSVGVAQWRTGELMPGLLERVDAALYGAKDRGRNRVEVSP